MTSSSLQLSNQMLVGELVKRVSHRDPDLKAYIFEGEEITHREMDERATTVAAWLQNNGIYLEDKVGMLMKNSLAYIEIFFGITLSGGVGVPINFRLTAPEVEYIVNNSDTKILFIDHDFIEMIQSIRDKLPKVEKVIVYGTDEVPEGFLNFNEVKNSNAQYVPCDDLQDEDPALIVYTSGTTGRPKGAVLKHKSLVLNTMNIMLETEGGWYRSMLTVVPLFHIAGIMSMIRVPMAANCKVLQREFNPVAVWEAIDKYKINGVALVPTMWNFLFQVPNYEKYDVSSVTTCTVGGAITPLPLKQKIVEVFHNAKLLDTFGQTETSSFATSLYGDDVLTKPRSVGRSIVGVEVRIVDEKMNDVEVGEVGEIVYRGPTVMKEYYNNPEATAEAFRGGWFHSGDLVKMDEEGYIYVVDRKNDMIISGGENIYPAELEERLATHPAILESAVIGVPDDTWGEVPKVYLALKPGEQLTEQEVIDYVVETLASYKKPKYVTFVDALPRNPSGKVLKFVLKEMHQKEQISQ